MRYLLAAAFLGIMATLGSMSAAAQQAQQQDQGVALMMLGNCSVKEAISANQVQQLTKQVADLKEELAAAKGGKPAEPPK